MTTEGIDYKALAKELLAEQTTLKAVGSTPTAVYGHGPGGLFSTPGLQKPLFSTLLLPRVGLRSQLTTLPTNETNPIFGIMTGVTASTGSEPTGVCDDPPVVGTMKLCQHSFVFGRMSRQTKVFDLDRVGQVTNRGEFLDLQLVNNPLGDNNPSRPNIPGSDASRAVQNEIAKALFEMGVAWSRDFAKIIYTGSPTNNTAGGGYKEFYGLEYLVNTGYRDAITGVVCPAADSIVRSFGHKQVASNAAELIRTITNMYRNLKFIASRANMDPVEFKIVMPFAMFYEITEVWPISYMTYRALAIPTGSTNFVDSSAQETMRDSMRGDLFNYTGQFLLIDGQKVPVILDDALPETQSGPIFESDIYILPFKVLGGIPSLYMEYLNYDGPYGPMEAAKVFAPGDMYYTTDSGRFLWHKKPPTNFCVQLLAKTEPRLILTTPYLAARLTDIYYSPVMHERSPFTDSGYYADGGNVTYPAPSFYTPHA